MKAETKKRLIRYTTAAFAALAVAQGARVYQAASRDVVLVYSAPAGALRVQLRDDSGASLRRVEFADQTPRRHALELGEGSYEAQLNVAGQGARRVRFVVVGDGVVEVRWRAGRP